ncbi:MAG: ketopantoate reductase family protein [Candidatus Omnitrophota bacterium]
MKIAVIGAGAIGSVLAGYLTQVGEEVQLIAHPAQLAALKDKPLVINGVRGRQEIKVRAEPALRERVSLIIMATKTQDIYQALKENQNFMKKPLVLSTQNGVQADWLIRVLCLEKNIMSSIVMFGATFLKPGEVVHNFEGDIIIGRPFIPLDMRVNVIARVLKQVVPVVISKDIMGMKWMKLFVNFNNCLPAVLGKSMQDTFSDERICALSIRLLKEGLRIVDKAGIKLLSLPNFPEERVRTLAQMPIEQTAAILKKTMTGLSQEPLYGSILQSILRKRKSEIDYINGEIVSLAKDHKLRAPLNEQIVKLVHQVESDGKFLTPDGLLRRFK